MKIYNKLVRDKIPDIIRARGQAYITLTLTGAEYQKAIDAKLVEGLNEYLESGDLRELADLLEVIYAAAEARGCPVEALEILRREKAEMAGKFTRGILLISTEQQNRGD